MALSIALLASGLVLDACSLLSPEKEPIQVVARAHGVSVQKVATVAAAIDVPVEMIGTYGPDHFPLGYFVEQFRGLEERQGYVTRADVDDIVNGYEARCQPSPGTVFYLFYSRNIDLNLWGPREEALLLRFTYRHRSEPFLRKGTEYSPADLILDNWRYFNLRDSGLSQQEHDYINEHCLDD